MDMSFKEKSAWISLLSTVLIFGYYFFQLLGLGNLPSDEVKQAVATLAVKTVVLIAVVEAVFHAMLAATNRKAAEMGADERDNLIALKANNYGYTVLVIGVIFGLGHMVIVEFNPQFTSESSLQIPMLKSHILLFSLILSEVVRFAGQVLLYRRGY